MKKRILLTLLLCVAILFSFVACNSESSMGENGAAMDGGYGAPESNGKDEGLAASNRKIITTVNERVETEAYDALIEGLKTAVAEAGGYFVSSNYSGNGVEDDDARRASFEIRIPAEKLSAFTGKVGTLGTVLSYKETANDVTLAYVDIESRIAVLEAEETALLAILKGATKTSDILDIRDSLTDTQSELASLRAQKRTYDTLIAYSTVHLTVNEVARARSEDDSFFSEIADDFMTSLDIVGSFFRGLAVFLLGSSPILLLIAAIGVGIFFLRRFFARRKAEKENAEKLQTEKREEQDPKEK